LSKQLSRWMLALCLTGIGFVSAAADTSEERFRHIYKVLVETNTTASVGSCTLAAERMAAELKKAGFEDNQLNVFFDPKYPKEGGLIATLPGKDAKAKAILLLAHIDVVEAKREDWTRDPFTLIEENGNFYARGASDDKAEAAIWVDTLVRLHEEKSRPRRTIKMALTCGEEGGSLFNGAEWLAKNHKDWIDAAFAINEGASGELDASGKPVSMTVEAGEKTFQNYRLEVTNPGGHSSRPRADNAIYSLAGALKQLESYSFPIMLSEGSIAYLNGMANIEDKKGHGDMAKALRAVAQNPNDTAAVATVSQADISWSAMLHTTCVATMLNAGHATNALPQRATANVNCRIFPGVSPASVRDSLAQVIHDPKVTVSLVEPIGVLGQAPPLGKNILNPIEKLTQEFWPGVPVLPVLQSGATDGRYLNNAGIPTYGIEGVFVGPDLGNIHGLNEYVNVASLLKGREFMYRLVKVYGDQP
jgi:acetylornithine deacetylase/succinyl-diaminopimelate desuccinylase-like protein